MNIEEYISRNYLVWKSGLAFGFPLFNLYTMQKQGIMIKKGLQTTYDELGGYIVLSCPVGWMRKITFVVLFAMLFMSQATINSIDRIIKNQEKQSAYQATESPTNSENQNWHDLSPIRQERQNELKSELEQQQKFLAEIAVVHPDVYQIANDPDFKRWIESQPYNVRANYERIYNNGTVSESIELLSNYKEYRYRSIKNSLIPPINANSYKNNEVYRNQTTTKSVKNNQDRPKKKECIRQPVMSDEDYRNCGLKPPSIR